MNYEIDKLIEIRNKIDKLNIKQLQSYKQKEDKLRNYIVNKTIEATKIGKTDCDCISEISYLIFNEGDDE